MKNFNLSTRNKNKTQNVNSCHRFPNNNVYFLLFLLLRQCAKSKLSVLIFLEVNVCFFAQHSFESIFVLALTARAACCFAQIDRKYSFLLAQHTCECAVVLWGGNQLRDVSCVMAGTHLTILFGNSLIFHRLCQEKFSAPSHLKYYFIAPLNF